MKAIIFFCCLTAVNVVIQTFKQLCTIKCNTFISACVNAVAYGIYTFVIYYTTADGIPLIAKAGITAVTNFFGVYVANFLFDRCFSREARWKVDVSVADYDVKRFEEQLQTYKLDYCYSGWFQGWTQFSVFCPDKKASACLKSILPSSAKYNITECVKLL